MGTKKYVTIWPRLIHIFLEGFILTIPSCSLFKAKVITCLGKSVRTKTAFSPINGLTSALFSAEIKQG